MMTTHDGAKRGITLRNVTSMIKGLLWADIMKTTAQFI